MNRLISTTIKHFGKKIFFSHFLFFLAFLVNISAQAQSSSSNQKKENNNYGNQSQPDTSALIEEKLVALALGGPLYKGSENQNKINEYQLKAAKNSWVNLLTISANYNDQTFASQNQVGNLVYPKYFFGLNIPLGTLLSRTTVKSAKEQIEISKHNQEQLSRNIRAEILSKYKRYKNYFAILSLQSQTLDDEETAFLQAKEKFRNGVITIEAYNVAQKKYNDELTKKLEIQLQQDLLKIDIERIIGITLESVK